MRALKYPTWWDRSLDFAWDHTKVAMERDWNRIKKGLRKNPAVTGTQVDKETEAGNGLKILLSSGHTLFDELESAFRFGYSAHLEYDTEWNDNLEISLAKEWRAMNPLREETWEHDRQAILYGWNFETEDVAVVAPVIEQSTQKRFNYFDTRVDQGNMLTA